MYNHRCQDDPEQCHVYLACAIWTQVSQQVLIAHISTPGEIHGENISVTDSVSSLQGAKGSFTLFTSVLHQEYSGVVANGL
jgi:hypothetical protein